MSMCPFCGKVYDESEYAGCPRCKGKARNLKNAIAKKNSREKKASKK